MVPSAGYSARFYFFTDPVFNIFLEFVMDKLKSLKQFQLDRDSDIRYAYETTLESVIYEKLHLSAAELETACVNWSLKSTLQNAK